MDEDGTGDSGAESDASNESAAFKSADQLAEELLTLSSMPAAFWCATDQIHAPVAPLTLTANR
jgi:hypothetical protein